MLHNFYVTHTSKSSMFQGYCIVGDACSETEKTRQALVQPCLFFQKAMDDQMRGHKDGEHWVWTHADHEKKARTWMQSLHQDFTISADFEESKRGERFEDITIVLLVEVRG